MKTIMELSYEIIENPTPTRLSEILIELSAWNTKLSDQIGLILKDKAERWMAIREQTSSDKQADMKYDATAVGAEEIILRLTLKSLEKMMSAVRMRLRVYEMEIRSQI